MAPSGLGSSAWAITGDEGQGGQGGLVVPMLQGEVSPRHGGMSGSLGGVRRRKQGEREVDEWATALGKRARARWAGGARVPGCWRTWWATGGGNCQADRGGIALLGRARYWRGSAGQRQAKQAGRGVRRARGGPATRPKRGGKGGEAREGARWDGEGCWVTRDRQTVRRGAGPRSRQPGRAGRLGETRVGLFPFLLFLF
jgi:hypothetical protein